MERGDKSALDPASIPKLKRLVKDMPEATFKIQAFTDNVEPRPDYNRGLSQKRADAVADQLRQLGMAKAQIIANGLGTKGRRFT